MSPRCPIFSTSCISITCIVSLLLPGHVRQQRHLAGALYGDSRLPLMLRTQARHAGGTDLASIRDETPEHVVVLVVDVGYVLLAEHARLALYRPRPARRTSSSLAHQIPPGL